jgi:hypothetical protein
MPDVSDDPRSANDPYERDVAAFLEAMRAVAREEASDARAHLGRLHAASKLDPANDADAVRCAEELERDAERALREESTQGWVEGSSSAPFLAYELLTERRPSAPVLERLCHGLSMIRQVLDLGFEFVDRCLGDDLMFCASTSPYERAVSAMCPELAVWAERAKTQRGLLITGSTKERRARVARALHLRYLRLATWVDPGRATDFALVGSGPGRVAMGGKKRGAGENTDYIEDDTLYAMAETDQLEVRRRLLITPPDRMLFGAPTLERFMEETPTRVSCRLLTYLFVDGQEHLDLDREEVHVGPPAPALPLPRRAP